MWIPTQSDAIDMFARHFEALHRSGSVAKARETASRLRSDGDLDGHEVWSKVADSIEQLRDSERLSARRQQETA